MADTTLAAIDVRGLTIRYGRQTVLQQLDLAVPAGALFALLGANGAGKSTLLRALAGIHPVRRGVIDLLGHDRARMPIAVQRQIAYVAEGQALPAARSVSELAVYLAPLYPAWDRSYSDQVLAAFHLPVHKPVGALSRGQRMKVSLWAALATRPKVLLMDEPFTGMEVAVKDELVRALIDVVSLVETTVLLCTHDLDEVEMLADWMALLVDGRITHAAPLESLRAAYAQRTGLERVPLKTLYLGLSRSETSPVEVLV